MKALVISDTHIKWQEDIAQLDAILEPYLDSVDVIIHAGDSVSRSVLEYLRRLKPLRIVAGNMDFADLVQELPHKLLFDLGSFRIGLTHGWGSPAGLSERVLSLFAGDRVDAIVYGHSHRPKIEKIGDILMLNPGSLTDSRFAEVNTFALLEADQMLEARIIEI